MLYLYIYTIYFIHLINLYLIYLTYHISIYMYICIYMYVCIYTYIFKIKIIIFYLKLKKAAPEDFVGVASVSITSQHGTSASMAGDSLRK
jgi:hypothetical protein